MMILIVASCSGDSAQKSRESFQLARLANHFPGSRSIRAYSFALAVALLSGAAFAQTGTVTRNAHLRPDPSTNQPSIKLLTAGEQLTLISVGKTSGYYHVKASDGAEGWVWARNIQLSAAAPPTTAPSATVSPGAGAPGSATQVGCGDGLWQHVYKPHRLIVKQNCITVSGVIVDATATQSKHQPDGVRHEGDGDTHGWLRVDPQFASLLNAGNASDEGGNLVFEVVCHFKVTQNDAKPACAGFKDTMTIPPVGTHVAITGSFVQDTNHAKWNEIHPVSGINMQ